MVTRSTPRAVAARLAPRGRPRAWRRSVPGRLGRGRRRDAAPGPRRARLRPTRRPRPTPTATPGPDPTAARPRPPTPAPVAHRPPPSPPRRRSSPASTCIARARWSASTRTTGASRRRPQSMVNLVRRTSNRTLLDARSSIYKMTRQHNRYRYATRGNDPQGWAWALRDYCAARRYTACAYTDKDVGDGRRSRRSIARTRDPVGITVRHGTHAWVVLGYQHEPIGDEPSKRTILGFYVSGPLGTRRRQVAVSLPDRSPVPAATSRATTSGSAGSSGKAAGWSSPSDPAAGRAALRWVATCTPSSWPAAAGPDSTP